MHIYTFWDLGGELASRSALSFWVFTWQIVQHTEYQDRNCFARQWDLLMAGSNTLKSAFLLWPD
jgi:hypothetical protein